MNYNKNQEIKLRFNDIGNEGEGIGRTDDGATFFVKGALPGEEAVCTVLKWKKTYGYARLKELTLRSKDRVEPKCPVAGRCGGCTLQHMSYEAQLRMKRDKVKNCLERIGGFEGIEVAETLGMAEPFYYRNKGQFPVQANPGKPAKIGFYAGHTHSVIDTGDCLIQHPVINAVVNKFREFIDENGISIYNEETGKGLLRHILVRVGFETREVCVCPVINGKDLPKKELVLAEIRALYEKLNYNLTNFSLNHNTEPGNVILGKKLTVVYGEPYIKDMLGSTVYCVSPLSFYQVNPVQTRKIYDKVREFAGLTGEETVWDIYCGAGTIGLYLSDAAKELIGIEIVPEAIEDAKRNAAINGVENASYYCGAAEAVLPKLMGEDHKPMDVAIIDPPRKGCDARLLETLLAAEPKTLVYVSCDPATLARDLKILCHEKYSIKAVQPVDAFCQTGHVETVCLLSRE